MNRQMRLAQPVWSRLIYDETGQDLIEYALVAAFIGLGAVASLKSLTRSFATLFTAIGTTLSSAV